jgi:hypothetical protein
MIAGLLRAIIKSPHCLYLMVCLEYNDISSFCRPVVIHLNIKYFQLQDMMETSALSIWIQSLVGKNLRSGKIMHGAE